MSLAITEKRQQQRRPGGCVGIFLQFLDWNRRFAKKKLFSRKLLPPARAARRASKMFGADDKMPMAKLLLIADENRGGFPSKKKLEADIGNDMRAPGLVARLMGLETMPVVAHERPRKAMDSKVLHKGDEDVVEVSRLDQDLGSKKANLGKTDSRPPKLQKTGEFLQRRPGEHDRQGRPNVSGKNSWTSHSSNKHHKLAYPVKSPRLLSGSHRARLMQAATKILEPGLQPRDRPKCAIAYVDSSLAGADATGAGTCLKKSKELLNVSNLRSCISYGSLDGMSGFEPREIEPFTTKFNSSAFQFSVAPSSSQGSMDNSTISLVTPTKQKCKLNPAVQAQTNMQKKACEISERKHHLQNHQKLDSTRKGNNFRQNQPLMVRDKVADKRVYVAKACSRKQSRSDLNELKTCMRSTGEVLNSHRVQLGGNSWEKNISCKRKNISFCNGDVSVFGSVLARESGVERDMINRNKTGFPSNQMIHRKYIEGNLTKDEEDHDRLSGRCSDMVSFTFSSPIRHSAKSSSNEEMAEKFRDQYQLNGEFSSKKNLMDSMNTNLPSQRRITLRGEEISSLVEQRTRDDELGSMDAQSTASILEELITNLTTGASISEKNGHIYTSGSSNTEDTYSLLTNLSDFLIPQHQMLSIKKESQEKAKSRTCAGLLSMDNDQPSPVSILEASFSNDSCFYGSMHASSGNQSQFGLTENQSATLSLDMDIDLLDSATSSGIMESNIENNQHSKPGLCEGKQPISNAEVIFKNFALYASSGIVDFALETFLLDLLEVTIGAVPLGRKNFSIHKDAKERDQLRECLFDCMIQSLASKYSHLCTSGHKNLLKIPLVLTQDQLIREVHEEIRGWMNLAGKKLIDDLIEEEMYNSNGMWRDCEIEALETGARIESGILSALVDEMVIDFCQCRGK